MVFDSYIYAVCGVAFVFELAGIKYITQAHLRTIRWFLAFCALRDALLLLIHGNAQAYWDVGWSTKQVELVWLAWIAGYIASYAAGKYEWQMSIPAFGVGILTAFNLPFRATPAMMQNYQWHAQIIIIGTVLIGCVLTVERRHLRLIAGLAIMAASGLISAVSFVNGNYSPRTAGLVWTAGLLALLVAAKDIAESPGTPRPRCAASCGE